MPTIPPDVVVKFGSVQNQIWQTVTMTVSENLNKAVTFQNPLVTVASTADLYSEMASPKLIIQFSFSSSPENSQVLLVDQETFAHFLHLVRGEPPTEVDDSHVADARPALEAIVQGICLAVGNIRDEAVVSSGLSIRYQIFSFPPNLQRSDELMRTNVAFSSETISGTIVWLMDSDTAHMLLGVAQVVDDAAKKAAQEANAFTAPPLSGGAPEDAGALEILMDIPLEISVELGRVRMLVREVVDLGSGSIVEIDKAAGEPVDVMVNGRLVARGEVVVIEDNFGVRITEILSPQERMARLNEVA